MNLKYLIEKAAGCEYNDMSDSETVYHTSNKEESPMAQVIKDAIFSEVSNE